MRLEISRKTNKHLPHTCLMCSPLVLFGRTLCPLSTAHLSSTCAGDTPSPHADAASLAESLLRRGFSCPEDTVVPREL